MSIERNMPLQKYLAAPEVSAHAIFAFQQSPEHCKRYLDGFRDDPTEAMEHGTLLHSLVFEGKSDWVVQPKEYPNTGKDRQSKPFKPWHNGSDFCSEWCAKQTQTVLTESEESDMLAWAKAVTTHKHCQRLLENGESEVSLFVTCPKTGLKLKTRLDWLRPKGVADLKTMPCASDWAVSNTIAKRGYHIQAAMNQYCCEIEGLDTPDWHIIALEKGKFPMVNVRLLKSDTIAIGRMELMRALEGIAECCESVKWPGYCDEDEPIGEIGIPAWAANQAMGGMTELVIGGEKISV